ncbi:hypothetical protein [Plesiocystis pacifica]|uniref:5'-methylthioadenosine/S-adenosylhomocysteine nucleosidase family protein n=1 Tax=Plesiocystis pacifica TaxID=191768 RepID=UPI0012F974CB|nr:hypothetical protein [Plesiocystis pacifica]
MTSFTRSSTIKGSVHFGIVTARPDEFQAVRNAFPDAPQSMCRGERPEEPIYHIIEHTIAEGRRYRMALIVSGQGNSAANLTSRYLLEDLSPKWLVMVGIAASAWDLVRCDVALATEVQDFRIQQIDQTGITRPATRSYQARPIVQNLINASYSFAQELGALAQQAAIGALTGDRSPDDRGVTINPNELEPSVHGVVFASSDTLVDNRELTLRWVQHHRYISTIDMESAGAAEACHNNPEATPFLFVRGISDRVLEKDDRRGFRAPAAAAAAATFRGLLDLLNPLHSELLPPTTAQPKSLRSGPAVLPAPALPTGTALATPLAVPSTTPLTKPPDFDFDAYYSYAAVKARCEADTAGESLGDQLRLKSFEWLRQQGYDLTDETLRPLVIESRHVHDRKALPGWDLAALLVFDPITLGTDKNTGRPTLAVDIRGEQEAIYDNRGKRFMNDLYYGGPNPPYEALARFSKDIHALQMQPGKRRLRWPLPKLDLPLRWSSGGFLPIVYREDAHGKRRAYFALFFRDIPPVGWNIANGASETPEERFALRLLSAREAAEELVVLEHEPERDADGRLIAGQVIQTRPLAPREDKQIVLKVIQKLTRVHNEERRLLDAIHLEPNPENYVLVDEVQGPADVSVKHDGDKGQPAVTRHVYITVNPLEFGIEVTQVGRFPLGKEEYLLDGETYMNRAPEKHLLVRRPVALFDLDWFEQALRQDDGSYDFPEPDEAKALAEVKRHAGCRRMPVPPSEHFELFDYDVRQRRQLVDAWLRSGKSTGDFKVEYDWLERDGWEDVFNQARRYADGEPGSSFPEELRYICSAAWKAMCLYFQHRHI